MFSLSLLARRVLQKEARDVTYRMELNVQHKCACADCGHIIEYSSNEAGKTIACPKCGEKSQLPEPEKLGLLEAKGPPLPQFKKCEVCGAQIKFFDPFCPICETNRRKRVLLKRIAITASLVFIAVVGVTVRQLTKPRVVFTPQPPGHMFMAAAVPKPPKSTNDLQPGRFVLERAHGETLATAVGDIKNTSDNVHHQIRADLDLLDKTGAKIGTASDYFVDLGAHQTWHFVVNVTETNAMSVRFAGFKED
jgi:DNA-directed RNA polymerase subunit RPC12/RpoP